MLYLLIIFSKLLRMQLIYRIPIWQSCKTVCNQFQLAIASDNSYPSYVLSKLPVCSITRQCTAKSMNQLFYFQLVELCIKSAPKKQTTTSEVIVCGKRNFKQNRNWFYFKFSVESLSFILVQFKYKILYFRKRNHAQEWCFNLTIISFYKILLTKEKKTCIFINNLQHVTFSVSVRKRSVCKIFDQSQNKSKCLKKYIDYRKQIVAKWFE